MAYDPAATTSAAKAWRGYGTALKPAWEGVLVAMKPLAGTFARNALEHGVAGLNVDAARIGTPGRATGAKQPARKFSGLTYNGGKERVDTSSMDYQPNEAGRWPANLALDEHAARELDAQSGESVGGAYPASRAGLGYKGQALGTATDDRVELGDIGGAPRFFFTAKAGDERHAEEPGGSGARELNDHPTVKPLDLCQWLVRLVRMPKGTRVLDPFTGSGSTLIAAAREGVDVVGIEREREYVEIARARYNGDAPLFNALDVTA